MAAAGDRIRIRFLRFAAGCAAAAFVLALATAVSGQGPLPLPAPVRAPVAAPAPGGADAAGAVGEDAAGADAAAAGTNRLYGLKFEQQALAEVLQFYSELTQRTPLIAPGVDTEKTKITVHSHTKLSREDTLTAIETLLSMNNIGIVRMGEKFYKVVPIATIRQESLQIHSAMPETPPPDNEQVISQVIALKYVESADILPIIQGLLHPYAKVQPMERANSVLITDTTANVNRVVEIVAQLDQPIPLREEAVVRKINHAKASEIKAKLEAVIADMGDKKAKPAGSVGRQRTSGPPGVMPIGALPPGVIRPPSAVTPAPADTGEVETERGLITGAVKIVADDRINILIIITRIENMAFFDKIITALDEKTDPDVIVKTFALEYAEAEGVAGLLNDLIGAVSKEKTAKPPSSGGSAAAGDKKEGAAAPPPAAESSPLAEYLRQRSAAAAAGGEPGKAKIGELSAANIKILSDKRTNSLIVMASPADMAAIEELVAKVDVMLSQVLIEVVILSVNLSDKIQSGVDWVQRSMIAFNEKGGGVRDPVFAFAGGGGGGNLKPANATAFNSAFSAGQGLTYYFTHFGLNLDAVVRWASTDSRTRILDCPVILTTDNKEAKIDVSSEQYFYKGIQYQAVSGTANYQAVPNVEMRSVGLNLTVKPHINQKKFVSMEITQKIESPGALQTIQGQGDWPTVNKRELSAAVSVRSGETIILGGLVEKQNIVSHAKIPLLGDLPLMGSLFRYSSDDDERQEVVVFITPRVLDTPEEIATESRRRKDAAEASPMWQRGWSDSKLAAPGPDEPQADGERTSWHRRAWRSVSGASESAWRSVRDASGQAWKSASSLFR